MELLEKVKKHILEEPLRLYMADFKVKRSALDWDLQDQSGKHRPFAPCGTAACIAGWGWILRPKNLFLHPVLFFKDEAKMFDDYANLFDVTTNQATRLFNPSRWPAKFRIGTFDNGSLETAIVACQRIDFFIKTKGTDIEVPEANTVTVGYPGGVF